MFLPTDSLLSLFIPPSMTILLALFGCLLWSRSATLAKALFFIAFISLWLFSSPLIAKFLINTLQRDYPPLALNTLSKQNHTAIIILGGGQNIAPEYTLGYNVSAITLARLQYAAYLYDKTHLPIIVSGGNPPLPRSLPEADVMKNVLQNSFKVPVAWGENQSLNTADEAKFLAPLLKEHKIETVYLVTNAWHMSRSIYAFHLAIPQIKIIPAPMGYFEDQSKAFALYFPSEEAMNMTHYALHEYIGLLWYHLYYGHSVDKS